MTVTIVPSNSLLNLPEEVLRIIFGYLNDTTLCTDVRPVCRQLKILIDNYVELGKLRGRIYHNSGFRIILFLVIFSIYLFDFFRIAVFGSIRRRK